MAVIDPVAFISWSVISAIFIVIVSIVHKKYSNRKKNESSSH